jgi:Holliday junction resolvase
MKTPENYEKDDICKYLDSIGAWYFKPMMTGYGKAGVPDIVGCIDGKFFSIEVKREKKLPTPLQCRRIGEIFNVGGRTFWGPADKVIGEFEGWRQRA